MQQGGFSRPGFADDGEQFAFSNGEGKMVEQDEVGGAGAINLFEVRHPEDGRRRGQRSRIEERG